MSLFSKKEKFTIEIDKNIYADFCVKCAQKNVNDIIEGLIKNYLKENKAEIKEFFSIKNVTTENVKHDFKTYLTQTAVKTTGEHYSENVSKSYSSAINTCSKYCQIDLWGINNSTKVSELFSKIQKEDDFIDHDNKTQRTLSNGVKRYIEFLEYVEKK